MPFQVCGRRPIPELTCQAHNFSDEDDVSASGISHRNGQPVRLRTHLPGVEGFARCHASACGLSDELVEAISRADLLHDVDKADPPFSIVVLNYMAIICNGADRQVWNAWIPVLQIVTGDW